MAQARPGKSDSDSLAYHMRELHLKLHRNNAETMASSKSPTSASSQNKADRNASSPRENLGRNMSTSRNVYTWKKSQLEQTQGLQRTVSPITVDTKWGSEFMNKSSFSDISQVSVAKSPTHVEVIHSKNLDKALFENLHNCQMTKTDQASLNNSPDSGLSFGSDGASPCTPSVYMANQVRPMSFPHPNLHKAFKPIGAVVSNNPLPMNLVQLSQNSPITSSNANQWMQQPWIEKPHNFNAQTRCFREMSPNSIVQPLSVNLTRPASPLLKVSPSFSNYGPCLSSPQTHGSISKSELSPGVLSNAISISPLSSSSRSSTFPSNSSAKNPSSPSGVSFTTSSIIHLTEESNPQQKGESAICSCNRSPKMILCKACGEMCQGRMRQRCKAHPNQIFLMDIRCCPHCQSENLKEIDCSKKA